MKTGDDLQSLVVRSAGGTYSTGEVVHSIYSILAFDLYLMSVHQIHYYY